MGEVGRAVPVLRQSEGCLPAGHWRGKGHVQHATPRHRGHLPEGWKQARSGQGERTPASAVGRVVARPQGRVRQRPGSPFNLLIGLLTIFSVLYTINAKSEPLPLLTILLGRA